MSWRVCLGKSPFWWPSSCSFLGLFLAFRFRLTSGLDSGLSTGTFHPVLVTCRDPAKTTFCIWDNTWLLMASFMGLWICTLTEFIISSISRDMREFSWLDNLLISALELAVTELRSKSALVPGLITLWSLRVSSSSFSDSLLMKLPDLLGKLLFRLSSLSLALKWFSPSMKSKFSMFDSISSPLDFLAFFCFLVVGIETKPGQILNYLNRKTVLQRVYNCEL